jgi:hypothetical protein
MNTPIDQNHLACAEELTPSRISRVAPGHASRRMQRRINAEIQRIENRAWQFHCF